MNYRDLKTLIESHPGWPGVDNATLTAWVNAAGAVARTRDTITTAELYSAIAGNPADYNALTQAQKEELSLIFSAHAYAGVNVTAGSPVRNRLVAIFAGTATATDLQAIVRESVTRGENAGLGFVRQGEIEYARTL